MANPLLFKKMRSRKHKEGHEAEEMLPIGSTLDILSCYEELLDGLGIPYPTDEDSREHTGARLKNAFKVLKLDEILERGENLTDFQIVAVLLYMRRGLKVLELCEREDEEARIELCSVLPALSNFSKFEIFISVLFKILCFSISLIAAWQYAYFSPDEDLDESIGFEKITDISRFISLISQFVFLAECSFHMSNYPVKLLHFKDMIKNDSFLKILKGIFSSFLGFMAIIPFSGLEINTFLKANLMLSMFIVTTFYSLKSFQVLLDAFRPVFFPEGIKKIIFNSYFPKFMQEIFFSLPEETLDHTLNMMAKDFTILEHLADCRLEERDVPFFNEPGIKYKISELLTSCRYSLDEDIKKIHPKPWGEAVEIYENREISAFKWFMLYIFLDTLFEIDSAEPSFLHREDYQPSVKFLRSIVKFLLFFSFWFGRNLATVLFSSIPLAINFLFSLDYYSNSLEIDNVYAISFLAVLSAIGQTLPFIVSSLLFLRLAKREIVQLLYGDLYLTGSWLLSFISRIPSFLCNGESPLEPLFGYVKFNEILWRIIPTLVSGGAFLISYRLIGIVPSYDFEDYAIQAQEYWQLILADHENWSSKITELGDIPLLGFLIHFAAENFVSIAGHSKATLNYFIFYKLSLKAYQWLHKGVTNLLLPNLYSSSTKEIFQSADLSPEWVIEKVDKVFNEKRHCKFEDVQNVIKARCERDKNVEPTKEVKQNGFLAWGIFAVKKSANFCERIAPYLGNSY